MNELRTIFGSRISNALLRNGINDIRELKEYRVQYPFYENKSAYIWRHIGSVSYETITTYLKTIED